MMVGVSVDGSVPPSNVVERPSPLLKLLLLLLHLPASAARLASTVVGDQEVVLFSQQSSPPFASAWVSYLAPA
jgi:hypothetical protein